MVSSQFIHTLYTLSCSKKTDLTSFTHFLKNKKPRARRSTRMPVGARRGHSSRFESLVQVWLIQINPLQLLPCSYDECRLLRVVLLGEPKRVARRHVFAEQTQILIAIERSVGTCRIEVAVVETGVEIASHHGEELLKVGGAVATHHRINSPRGGTDLVSGVTFAIRHE